MNRRLLLITACCFAAISVGLNVWLLVLRRDRGAASPPAAESPAAPALQPVQMDFSGTAFADDSWKLDDKPAPGVSLDKPFKLEVSPAPAPLPDPPKNP
jgi:hypothetical protein